MQWIKRNLFLVLGAVVALGLLGIAGFYLWAKIQQDQGVTGELDAATQKLESLAKRDPYPNPENITAAKDEARRVQGFLTEVEKHFLPAPYPSELNNMEFRTYLDSTQSKLLADAKRAGVEVPTNYWFTFAAQKSSMNFTPSTLQPLASQLADIRTLCEVLFDAKVNSLLWIKRTAVDSQDTALGSQDYLTAKAVTNNWAVIMPYEVAFQGFSSELAAVFDKLSNLPHCFMVTNIVVEPAASAPAGSEDQQQNPSQDLASRYGLRPDSATLMRQRYGMGGRYGRMMPPPPPVVVATPVRRGPANILDEKPLRFTLSIQAVKLKPRSELSMQFLKKHYEKVLLSIVLLGLAGAAAALPWQVSHERDRLEEIRRNLTVKVKPKPFKPLDEWLGTNKTLLARLETPLNLDLSGPHNLFNPVPWKKLPDGRLVPIRTGSELGPGAVKIAQIRELLLTVSYEVAPTTNPGEPVRYLVSLRRETDSNPRPIIRTVNPATPRNQDFELVSVQGATNDPTALVIRLKELKEEFEPITVQKDKPFTRVIGYAADLDYPPGKQKFSNKRPNDQIKLEDDPETYKIVAITRSEVVLSADSNKRRTVIKSNATTASNTISASPPK